MENNSLGNPYEKSAVKYQDSTYERLYRDARRMKMENKVLIKHNNALLMDNVKLLAIRKKYEVIEMLVKAYDGVDADKFLKYLKDVVMRKDTMEDDESASMGDE